MNKQKRLIIGVILVTILLMAIGYAGLTETPLNITGTASAIADQNNFKVYFTNENTKVSEKATVSVTSESTEATINITGLKGAEETQHAILEIKNGGQIDATSVTVKTQGKTSDYITITAIMCDKDGNEINDYSLVKGDTTYVKVSAKLKQILNADVSTDINITVEAVPDKENK